MQCFCKKSTNNQKFMQIVAKRTVVTGVEYLVEWTGFAHKHQTWINANEMQPLKLQKECHSLAAATSIEEMQNTETSFKKFKQFQPKSEGEITGDAEIDKILDVIRLGEMGQMVCLVTFKNINRPLWVPVEIMARIVPNMIFEYFESRIVWPQNV